MTAARTISTVPPDRVRQLESGNAQTSNLVEALAMDLARLMREAVPHAGEEAALVLDARRSDGVVKRMQAAGSALLHALGMDAAMELRQHTSDTVRGWAAYVVGLADGLDLPARLNLMRPLADDEHFAVREWAWMAIRPHIAADPDDAIRRLAPWSRAQSANVRRFACEATRPRGVWCAHIRPLVDEPARGLAILDPLKADPSTYVQDSVGNWLNDAAKSQPAWVKSLCARWRSESRGKETERICRRATRNL